MTDTQPQPAHSGGNSGNIAITTGLKDDDPDDIRNLGDRIGALTLVQIVQLGLYLHERHGLPFSTIWFL